jgi:hypothetical protein
MLTRGGLKAGWLHLAQFQPLLKAVAAEAVSLSRDGLTDRRGPQRAACVPLPA